MDCGAGLHHDDNDLGEYALVSEVKSSAGTSRTTDDSKMRYEKHNDCNCITSSNSTSREMLAGTAVADAMATTRAVIIATLQTKARALVVAVAVALTVVSEEEV